MNLERLMRLIPVLTWQNDLLNHWLHLVILFRQSRFPIRCHIPWLVCRQWLDWSLNFFFKIVQESKVIQVFVYGTLGLTGGHQVLRCPFSRQERWVQVVAFNWHFCGLEIVLPRSKHAVRLLIVLCVPWFVTDSMNEIVIISIRLSHFIYSRLSYHWLLWVAW